MSWHKISPVMQDSVKKIDVIISFDDGTKSERLTNLWIMKNRKGGVVSASDTETRETLRLIIATRR